MNNTLQILILSVVALILFSCSPAPELYNLSKSPVQREQEFYASEGGKIVVEQGEELEGPFARGAGVASDNFPSISLAAGDKRITCKAEPGHRIEAWSYLMKDGRAYVVARQFRVN